jgi:hypothetical protein
MQSDQALVASTTRWSLSIRLRSASRSLNSDSNLLKSASLSSALP